MQKKTIKKNLQNKMNSWLESITDENLRKEVHDNLIVSGGSICNLFLNEEVNDYDVYIKSEQVCFKLAKYYAQAFHELEVVSHRQKDNLLEGYSHVDSDYVGIRKVILENLKDGQVKILMPNSPSGFRTSFEDESLGKYLPMFFSPNAISLTDKVQVVLRFTGTVEEIHKSFDFIHATNYFTMDEGLVTNIKALESILSKQLYYQGSLYPVTTIIRIKKFLKRNWNITAGEQLKVMFDISQLDLTDVYVLEDQVSGIDVAFFGILIDVLKEKVQSDPDWSPSRDFIVDVINKIFNGDAEGN